LKGFTTFIAKYTTMVTFPNAKINLGLFITKRRPDGFHNIETIFVPIPKLCDILEIVAPQNQKEEIVFNQTGLTIDGNSNDNLCVKAYYKLKEKTQLPNINIHLHKQIPMGAGLGGGSADGAFALKMLNALASNPLSEVELAKVALSLGSDCPFFLKNEPCFAKGQGEMLEPIGLNLSGYHILLVNPGIHVATGMTYSQSTPRPAPINLKVEAQKPMELWKESIVNDFEKVVFRHHSEIENVKAKLYSLGAVYASMSGSGSTVFGIFKTEPIISKIFDKMFTYTSAL
jgi:4-diphosphocytidyl-2-C-methyl-D-erythritol kinase